MFTHVHIHTHTYIYTYIFYYFCFYIFCYTLKNIYIFFKYISSAKKIIFWKYTRGELENTQHAICCLLISISLISWTWHYTWHVRVCVSEILQWVGEVCISHDLTNLARIKILLSICDTARDFICCDENRDRSVGSRLESMRKT